MQVGRGYCASRIMSELYLPSDLRASSQQTLYVNCELAPCDAVCDSHPDSKKSHPDPACLSFLQSNGTVFSLQTPLNGSNFKDHHRVWKGWVLGIFIPALGKSS